jgi:DNA-binding CsgD family transcriptional regulator
VDRYNLLLTKIYDCAANPELWEDTLCTIRDEFGCAYASLFIADHSTVHPNSLLSAPSTMMLVKTSPWDMSWFAKMNSIANEIPNVQSLLDLDIDTAWIQFRHASPDEVFASKFYKEWAEPQGLIDAMNLSFMKRASISGSITMARANGTNDFTDEQAQLAEALSPHIRRALAINDIVDKGRLAQSLLKSTLDQLACAVVILGPGRSLTFANSQGEAFLSAGEFIRTQMNILNPINLEPGGLALCDAIDRAATGDIGIGIRGIGVPLIAQSGERLAAYVLPLAGSGLRAELGRGNVAVFIARRNEQQPMLIEIMRTLFDMTLAEARVAAHLAQGQSPSGIAEALGVSVHTVRTHLGKAYAKSQTNDQTSLVSLVKSLSLPLALNAGP